MEVMYLNLVYAGGRLYLESCHPRGSSKADGLVEPVCDVNRRVIGFACTGCHKEVHFIQAGERGEQA